MVDTPERARPAVRGYVSLMLCCAGVSALALTAWSEDVPTARRGPARRAGRGPLPTGDTSRLADWPRPGARAAKAVAPAGPERAEPKPAPPARSELDRLLEAMRLVESVGGRKRVGDGGRSLGDYHIGRQYWREATAYGGVRWAYETHVWSRRHCRQVMIWYWQQWCPEALARVHAARAGRASPVDLATLARVHNGGPWGASKPITLRYWRRIRMALNAVG